MKRLTIFFLCIIICCQEKEKQYLPEACLLEPDPGDCLAAIPRFYYDPDEKKCREFTWGGCDGVVPFETLKECEDACDGG